MSSSPDLVWQIIRNRSAFLVKRDGQQFSTEKGNLTNLNAYKYNGLANDNTVNIQTSKHGVRVTVVRKGRKTIIPFKRRDPALTNKGINTLMNGQKKFRGDLVKSANARFSRLYRTRYVDKKVVEKRMALKKKRNAAAVKA